MPGQALYARLLGVRWHDLPGAIREMHDVRDAAAAHGRASVERGGKPLARLAALLFGFPPAAADTPVRVHFSVRHQVETWTRSFGEAVFRSRQYAGAGRWEGLLCERFGALTFAAELVFDGRRLALVLRHWKAFGVPLPMALCPRSTAHETEEDGRFHFHVEIGHPLTGLIVRYRGWLVPEAESRRSV